MHLITLCFFRGLAMSIIWFPDVSLAVIFSCPSVGSPFDICSYSSVSGLVDIWSCSSVGSVVDFCFRSLVGRPASYCWCSSASGKADHCLFSLVAEDRGAFLAVASGCKQWPLKRQASLWPVQPSPDSGFSYSIYLYTSRDALRSDT